MKLDVIQSAADAPWFDQGLTFTCQQCGNCCTGGPGYVWISDEEIDRMIQTEVLASEKAELGKLDELESEIAKELGAAKQKD